jgi:hypothetical protein
MAYFDAKANRRQDAAPKGHHRLTSCQEEMSVSEENNVGFVNDIFGMDSAEVFGRPSGTGHSGCGVHTVRKGEKGWQRKEKGEGEKGSRL